MGGRGGRQSRPGRGRNVAAPPPDPIPLPGLGNPTKGSSNLLQLYPWPTSSSPIVAAEVLSGVRGLLLALGCQLASIVDSFLFI